MFKRFGALAMLSLAATAVFIVGCGDGGIGASPKPTLAPTSIQPTWIRITVTPQPTETPTPTPSPTPTISPEDIDYGPPEFPLELDPDLVEERPEDDVIFKGWTRFLNNTAVVRRESEPPLHLCLNGLIMTANGPHPDLQNWRVQRSAALSFLDWGTIAVRVDIVGGPWAGREWTPLTLVRRVDKVFLTNNPNPAEADITRSDICLQSL